MRDLALYVVCLFVVIATRSVFSVDSRCYGNICFLSTWDGYLPRTLDEAQEVCNSTNGSWLLEINNKSVHEMVMTFLWSHAAKLGDSKILLGLKRHDQKWTWCDGVPYDGALSNSKFKIETSSQPFATLRNLNLNIITLPGSVTTTSKLRSFICSFKRRFNNETNSLEMGGQCYTINEDKDRKTWFEAQEFCSNQGGGLAVMSNNTEEEIINNFLPKTKNMENYWIGLTTSYWSWMNSEEKLSNFTMWYDGYPLQNMLDTPGNEVFTRFSFKDGGIWMDEQRPVVPVAIVCMYRNTTNSASQTTFTHALIFPTVAILFRAIID